MPKALLVLLLCFGSSLVQARVWRVAPSGADATRIQDALCLAQMHDTVLVTAGHYKEGNLLIDHPITLLGEGYPVLDGQWQDEVITITASGVVIRGFDIRYSGQVSTKELSGIKVLSCSDVLIENNRIYHCNYGIFLSDTRNTIVRGNKVQGYQREEQNTGNGIHLWKCSNAVLEQNYTTNHRDGIYFEFVTDSHILNNFSEYNMRYGLHFMFSHADTYKQNTFQYNGAGVAVMYSRQVRMEENIFRNNWGSASYGLLLKDISDSQIRRNQFEQNSAGVYMEGTSRIQFEENQLKDNGWALRVQASCDNNVITKNNFTGNSFDVSTNGHLVLNDFQGNYWDKYEGYDLDKDGIGDVPFRPVTLYSVVIEKMPAGLFLLHSFMVHLLDRIEKVFPSLTPEMLHDTKPATTRFVL